MPTEPRSELSHTRYFWLQLALLSAGLGGLWLAQRVAGWHGDRPTGSVTFWTTAVVVAALGAVARSSYVVVTSAFSDAYRVFRSRHLLVCGGLLAAAAVLVTVALVVHEPFGRLLAHGHITGEDMADVGASLAAIVCSVGAAVAFMGAWDALHEERHWH